MAVNTAACISLTLWMDPSVRLVLEQVFICKEEAGRRSLYNVPRRTHVCPAPFLVAKAFSRRAHGNRAHWIYAGYLPC